VDGRYILQGVLVNGRSGLCILLAVVMLLAGCAAGPTARVHHTIQQDPGSRPLQQVVLMPVDVDVYEMSTGGIREEVPEWSDAAGENVRSAMLVSRKPEGGCCVTREVDSSALTAEERDIVEEHLALFNSVAANAMWANLPANPAWHFKAQHFDYTLGDGLAFLKTKYGIDAGLIIIGEDVVSTAGRKTTAVVGAMFGVYVPLGHSTLVGGLVDFGTGDLLWLNHTVSGGDADLRQPDSALELARELMAGYPALDAAAGTDARGGD
jgi:hypothetical protein